MSSQLAILAGKEFSDRLRSGWVIACALVWLGAIGLTSLFGLVQVGKIGVQGYERTVVSLLNLVQYLVPLLGLLLGHDLLVHEREERTLALVLAAGIPRRRVLLGKFLGGCLTLALPLVLGFAIAGTVIRLAAGNAGIFDFLRLALTGLALGVVFLSIGLLISAFCRTRVQALVLALLAWCVAVFVFDLVAMGVMVSARSHQAAREVETITEPTHVNAIADMHAAYENGDDAAARTRTRSSRHAGFWLLLNPVDMFRFLNVPTDLAPSRSWALALMSALFWLTGSLVASIWKLERIDL